MASGSGSGSGSGSRPVDSPDPPAQWQPSNIEIPDATKLTSSNYSVWKNSAKIILDALGVWGVTSGTEKKPEVDHHENWSRKNKYARMILLTLISEEFQLIIGQSEDASKAWKDLEDTLDCRNVLSAFHALNALLSMQKSESTAITAHLHSYEQNWNRLVEKVGATTQGDELCLHGLSLCCQDQKMKANLLLRTLPKSMDNIVDNLQSKADLSYNDVRTRLLDLNVSTSSSADVLFVKRHKKDRGNRGNNSGGRGNNSNNRGSDNQQEKRKGIPPKDECSYCWKRSLPSKGHLHNDCSVLKQNQGKPGGQANVATSEPTGFAFSAVSLHSAVSQQSAESSIFDTAATEHI